jgi:PAS domain S-box-containing protein
MPASHLAAELLLDHMSDAVVSLAADTRVRYANGKAAMLYRRPVQQLEGRSFVELFPELAGSRAQEQFDASMQAAIPTRFEFFIPSLFAWHSVLAVPQSEGMVLFCRDITDRVRREHDEAVRAAVQGIVEDLPICVTITRGKNHRIELVNKMARALVGERRIEGELLATVLPEAREQGFIDLLDGVLATGQRYEGKELALAWTPLGQSQPQQGIFNLVYQPLLGPSGQVDGVLHLGVEITEQVRERQVLASYAAERAAILQQLTEGVIVTDAQGRITFVNDAAKRLHGVAVLGVEPEHYTHTYNLLTEAGEPYPPEQLPLAQAVQGNRAVTNVRWKIRRPDGTEVLVVGSAKPIMADDGRRLACVLTLAQV